MKYLRLTLIIVLCLTSGGCSNQLAERILFDFESDYELDRFGWSCYTLFSLSDEHVTHGTKSLRLELFPSDYPGLTPIDIPRDWTGHKAFCFDVYSAQDSDILLTIRIDDRKDNPDFPERYNHKLNLNPGPNAVCLTCDSLVTSGTQRKMNLRNISQIVMYMIKPEQKVVLFFDYFRLVR